MASTVAASTVGVLATHLNGVEQTARIHLHAVRVLGCDGGGSTTGVFNGLAWVYDNGIAPALLTLSLGAPASPIIDEIVNALRTDRGFIPVAAAGNENSNACGRSPARAVGAVTVAATRITDHRSSFSNFGTCVDIFAPGEDVLGAQAGTLNSLVAKSGRGMSTPHVVGGIARVLLANPGLGTAEAAWQSVHSDATTGVIPNPAGSPNRLLFIGSSTPPPLPPPSPPSIVPSTSPAPPASDGGRRRPPGLIVTVMVVLWIMDRTRSI